VLILGGGFAGVGAARALRKTAVDVVVVDAHDYHTFTPMIYQLATGLIGTETVAHPLRDIFDDQKNAVVHQATVTRVDLERRSVEFADMTPLEYDFLVIALGAEVEYFGVEGAPKHAFPLYGAADAVRLREHLLRMWEAADRDASLVSDGALNVVIVGGGPTGVESAGALAELYHTNFAHDYPDLPVDEARLILVEAGPELFSMFKPDIRAYAARALEDRGVELLLGEIVESISPTSVTLKSGTVLPAHTLVWGAGMHASPVAGTVGVTLERGRRLPVEPDLTLAGQPTVFATGDCAWITEEGSDSVLPQLGSVALQAGEHAGASIARIVDGKRPEPFSYDDKGTMAAIGRGTAVLQLRNGRTVKGKAAWLAWGGVHLALLSTGEDRAKTVLDWTWAGFTHDRTHRVDIESDVSTLERSH
jgi:NADH dehydrogenase